MFWLTNLVPLTLKHIDISEPYAAILLHKNHEHLPEFIPVTAVMEQEVASLRAELERERQRARELARELEAERGRSE